jgi:hypothetical protein
VSSEGALDQNSLMPGLDSLHLSGAENESRALRTQVANDHQDDRLTAMKLISSRVTYFQKRVFPCIWFSFLMMIALAGGVMSNGPWQSRLPILLGPLVMSVFGYALFRKLLFDLVDEVYDLGDTLLVRNKGMEIHIPLANIINVSASTFTNPPRITLRLREPCDLGKDISFIPPTNSNPFKRSMLGNELIDRIDSLRRA